MKIVFAGTPEIAKIVLANILEQFKVSMVLTQPDRPKGRGNKVQFSPVKQLALEHKIELLQPENLKYSGQATLDKISILAPDIIVVVAYGLILPKNLLMIPRLGCINMHVSLLPKLRGAAPIQRAIINGEQVTGVTIIQMDEGMDSGDILLQQQISIDNNDNSGSLHLKLANIGSKMITEYLNNYNVIPPRKQAEDIITYAPKIEKHEANINWQDNATLIWRKIRGFNPSPGCFSKLNNQIVKIWQAKIGRGITKHTPGTIIRCDIDIIHIACGQGTILEVLELQLAGKNKQTAQQFINGYPGLTNMRFSGE